MIGQKPSIYKSIYPDYLKGNIVDQNSKKFIESSNEYIAIDWIGNTLSSWREKKLPQLSTRENQWEGSHSTDWGTNQAPIEQPKTQNNDLKQENSNSEKKPKPDSIIELTEQTIKNFLKEFKGIDGESIAVYPAQYGSNIWAIKGKFANGSDFSYESEFKDHSDMESKLTTILNRSLGSKDYSFPIDRNLNYYRQYYTTK